MKYTIMLLDKHIINHLHYVTLLWGEIG